MRLKSLAILAVILSAAVLIPVAGEGATIPAPPEAQLPRIAIPQHYKLEFTIDPRQSRFSGHTEIAVNFTAPQQAIFLHGRDLKVSRVTVRLATGISIAAHYTEVNASGVARLTFDSEVPAGAATLVFDYDAAFDASLAGLYKVVDKGDAYAFTQFEDTDARRAFPSFDEPGFKTPFDVTVTAPAQDKVIANTDEISAAKVGTSTRHVFETTKALPTYLVVLAVGPLDIVDGGVVPPNAWRKTPLHLRGITAKGQGARIHYALSLTPKIVTALENYFRIAYPFQKLDTLAVPDFAAGAMENAGGITYREELLLMDDNAPLRQKRSSLDVQAHEITHQWFGDLVTPKWWDDIWLNESFATWMEAKASNIVMPDWEFGRETEKDGLDVMDLDELPSARQIHQPVHNHDDIDNAFDDITYSKGAAVLSMFESYAGEEAWRDGIHAYLTKYARGNASEQDFIGTIAQASKQPELPAAFESFIDQPGIPLVTLEPHCGGPDEAAARLSPSMYTQIGRPILARQWQVPACVASARSGAKTCALVTHKETDIALHGSCPSAWIPNAKGRGYYRYRLEQPEWKGLIAQAGALDPADQLALLYNVDAGLRANYANADNFLAAIAALAPVAKWDALGEMDPRGLSGLIDILHNLRAEILPPSALPSYRAYLGKYFGRRLKALGLRAKPGESVADGLARGPLVRILVEEAQDQAVIAKLSKAGRIFVASGGHDTSGLPFELMPEAIRAALPNADAKFQDGAISLFLNSNDDYFRHAMIHAFIGSQDRAFLRKALALALTPKVGIGELRFFIRFWPNEPVAREEAWNWFKTNFKAIEARTSAQGLSAAPGILATSCDAASKNDLHAFFAPKRQELEGTPRTLAQAEEKIDRCIAFKQAKANELAVALGRAAR